MTQIQRTFTEAKKHGDATYSKGKPCMLCGCHLYWVRGHRCSACNKEPSGVIRERNGPAKDHYHKEGTCLPGRWIAGKKGEWPVMQGLENVEPGYNDKIGSYKQVPYTALQSGCSASDVAEC